MNDSPSSNIDIRPRTPQSMDVTHGTARPAHNVKPLQPFVPPPQPPVPPPQPPVLPPQPPVPPNNISKEQPLVSQEKFASIIFEVGKRLPKSRLKDVIFLCYNKVSSQHVLENAESATYLFKDMSVFGTLDRTNVGLIAELLHRIGMVKAKREVFEGTDITWPTERGKSYLDPFRCLLHDIIQQLSKQKLCALTGYCSLRGIMLEQEVDGMVDLLDFFVSLEDQEAIASDNIGLLKDFSEHVLKNQKVKDYIKKYEKETRKHRPILALTEEESGKLLTIHTLRDKPNVLLDRFYGSYDFPTSNKDPVEKRETAQTGMSKAVSKETKLRTYPQKQMLITPSMLSIPAIASPVKQEEMLNGMNASVSIKDEKSSLEPMDDSQSVGPLQSRDILPDKTASHDDDDSTEWFTLQHDYQGSLIIPCYSMNASPKGICFILSNEIFDRQEGHSEPTDREGSERDVHNLDTVFSDLNFDVHIKRNLTAKDICSELKELRNRDHSSYKAFICCILSHGNQGIILGKDGKEVNLGKIIGYFKGENCPTLIGKPKIFIIQACQGNSWQTVTTDTAPRSPTGEEVGMGTGFQTLPKEVDILLLLSTIPGYKSARSREKGSWFIMALTHILKKHPDAEMQSIMTLLNKELARITQVKEGGRMIAQTAFPSHTLRKLLFLKRAKHIQQN